MFNRIGGVQVGFTTKLRNFVTSVDSKRGYISSEEATKTALILPFLQLLGYDVFNPLECIPEYTADVGMRKSEKVDYALMVGGKPSIIIEAKTVGEDLSKHYTQLFRYFSATESKFAILTNGVEYWFYSDINEINKLDAHPFITLNLLGLDSYSITSLEAFTKPNFDEFAILGKISEMRCLKILESNLKAFFSNPTDAFVIDMMGDAYNPKMGNRELSTFKTLLKEVVSNLSTSVAVSDSVGCDLKYDREGVCEINLNNDITNVCPKYLSYGDIRVPLKSWKCLFGEYFKAILNIANVSLTSLVDIPLNVANDSTKTMLLSNKESAFIYTYYDKTRKGYATFKPIEIAEGVYLDTPPASTRTKISRLRKYCTHFGVDIDSIKIGVSPKNLSGKELF